MNLRRRALVAGLAVWPLAVRAQAPRGRIGWLSPWWSSSAPGDPVQQQAFARHEALRAGLRDLGYVEGKNLVIEHRFAEGKLDRLPALAAELVQLNVDLVLALEPPAVEAARKATRTIPIVMRSTDDPVERGWVASLARPGGNITGVATYSIELYGKRLQLLAETVPGLARVAALWDAGWPATAVGLRKMQEAARDAGVKIDSAPVRKVDEMEQVIGSAAAGGAGAMVTLRSPMITAQRHRVARAAMQSKLPTIYDDREFAEAGGLMSYGANLAASYRRAAAYIDKILKGARPADLPVEQPTQFELVINASAARAIGLTIPKTLLLRADRIIE